LKIETSEKRREEKRRGEEKRREEKRREEKRSTTNAYLRCQIWWTLFNGAQC
jgi:hypothetical protein